MVVSSAATQSGRDAKARLTSRPPASFRGEMPNPRQFTGTLDQGRRSRGGRAALASSNGSLSAFVPSSSMRRTRLKSGRDAKASSKRPGHPSPTLSLAVTIVSNASGKGRVHWDARRMPRRESGAQPWPQSTITVCPCSVVQPAAIAGVDRPAVTRRLQRRRSASVDAGARGFFSVQDLPKLRFRAFVVK